MSLHDLHRAMLEGESGIRADVIDARGYQTVIDKADLEHLGFSPKQRNVPALLIPIYSPTGEVVLHQTRPDTPRINKGKPVKYETPSGSLMALDIHPFTKGKAGDPSTPLFITEGIKKGDALVTHGFCAAALIGVWNFRGTNEHGGKAALPEWEFIALNGRDCYIVFDSDVMTKKEVARALERLKAMLTHRGAKVKLTYLPDADDSAKQGVDDYLVAGHSVDDLLALATSELKSTPLPQIQVNSRFLRDISDDAIAALAASNDPPTYKDRKLLLDLWGGRSALAAAQRFGRGLTSRRDRVFGTFKLMNAGKDAVTNSNAYHLKRVATQTPETRQSTFRTTEAPSGTADDFTGFGPVFEAKSRETRQKPGDNPEPGHAAQDGVPKPGARKHRVSGVRKRPAANRNDDLSHLLGTTEGEL